MIKLDLDGNLLKRTAALESQMATKANVDFSNATKPYITETYKSGNNWYVKLSDGFIMQGGLNTNAAGTATYNLLKAFTTGNYTAMVMHQGTSELATYNQMIVSRYTTYFTASVGYAAGQTIYSFWFAFGY